MWYSINSNICTLFKSQHLTWCICWYFLVKSNFLSTHDWCEKKSAITNVHTTRSHNKRNCYRGKHKCCYMYNLLLTVIFLGRQWKLFIGFIFGFCPLVPVHKNRYKRPSNVQPLNKGSYKGVQWLLGSLSKSLRLALIRLLEVNFPQRETLLTYLGCIQP